MMDLPPVAQAILVYTVLAVGVLVTLLTGFAQLRELPRAWKSGPSAALVRRGFLAASVGMGSIGGTVLALELGGPGAVGWMWVASLVGMAMIYAEVRLAVRFRGTVDGRRRAGTVHAMAEGIPPLRLGALEWLGTPKLISGRSLALVFAIAFMVFAIAAGSIFQTQQSSVLLATLGSDRWLVAGFLVVTAAIGMLIPKLREFVVALGPIAVALYAIAAILMIVRAPTSPGVVLGAIISGMGGAGPGEVVGGVAGGTALMALQVGFLRATLATEAGIGSAGFTPQADALAQPEDAGAAAMLAPLISGIVVPTLTALVVLGATPWVGQRIDEPGERFAGASEREAGEIELAELAAVLSDGNVDNLATSDRTRVVALWAPLERPQARGTAASLQAGQTVVLPLDALDPEGAVDPDEGLREDHVYSMVMRSDPRGTKVPLRSGQDSILLNLADETQVIRELVFRDRDPFRAQYAAYDLRIPVSNELLNDDSGRHVRLSAADEGVDLRALAKTHDGPYVVFGDFHFYGRVVKMFQSRWGVHHAMIEATPNPRRPVNLRLAISGAGFRGPYFDNGDARAPLAMVAREDFEAPIGARLLMEYRPPARGLEIGHVLDSGELETPAWSFLAQTEWALIRHKTDPTQDMLIPVSSELVDGRLRFTSGRQDIADFAKADRWAMYTGPYLMPAAYRFEVEVHGGARFPASAAYLSRKGLERKSLVGPFSERRTLVPVHEFGEPQGSRGEIYEPHPAEVAPFLDGPWVAGEGLERVGWAARVNSKPGSDLLLAISVLILALTTMIAWSGYGARAADFAFGRGADVGFRIVFVLAGLAGATLALLPVIKVADYAMLGLVVLNGIGLLILLIRERRA